MKDKQKKLRKKTHTLNELLRKNFFCLSFCFISLLFLFPSCNKTVYDKAFTSKLDIVDVYITQNQYKDAMVLLKKIEKNAFSSFQRLGIIKRYINLGETATAERFLLQSLKKLPNNEELIAVYVELLLKNENYQKARDYAERLKDTKYSSLYSQLLLEQTKEIKDFYSDDYIQLYLDVGRATGENIWYRNAASLTCGLGQIKKAATYRPNNLSVKDMPEFWALVNYDAGDYVQAIEDASLDVNNSSCQKISSDSLVMLGEFDSASKFWNQLITDKNIVPSAETYKNAAAYALKKNDLKKTKEYLQEMVEFYPSYIAGLADYASFAVKTSKPIIESAAASSLRSTGLKTLQMDLNDNSPRIPVSDALWRMENVSEEEKTPELLIEYYKAKWNWQESSDNEITKDLWLILEKNRDNKEFYPYIVQYATTYFISHSKADLGWGLFSEYCNNKYGNDQWVTFAASLSEWEADIAGWYALYFADWDVGLRLYENVVLERATVASSESVMNLASLYTALGREDEALVLYGTLSSKQITNQLRSEIQYYIGKIQFYNNEKRNALLSLSYSIELNPNNHKARLLLKQLQ